MNGYLKFSESRPILVPRTAQQRIPTRDISQQVITPKRGTRRYHLQTCTPARGGTLPHVVHQRMWYTPARGGTPPARGGTPPHVVVHPRT